MSIKKLLWVGAAAFFLSPLVVLAVQISVPNAPGAGFVLISTTTGAYVATTTNPLQIGSLTASTTATSTFAGAVGIASSTPDQKLGVNGSIDISTSSSYMKLDATILDVKNGNYNDLNGNVCIGNCDTLIGSGAGAGLDSADFLTVAIGWHALNISSSTNSESTAIGWHSQGQMQSSGTHNTTLGINTLGYATSTSYDVALGTDAIRNATSSNYNIAIGDSAMANINTSYAVAIGGDAMKGNANGNTTANIGTSGNTAIGYRSMFGANSTTGNDNTAIGYDTLVNWTAANRDVAVGSYALANTTSGSSNNVIGWKAGINITTGNNNNCLGFACLLSGSALTGSQNETMGSWTGSALTSGGNNIFIGDNTASTTATGSTNIVIGYDILPPSINGSNQLDIGNLIFGTGLTSEGTTISTGKIGIATSTPDTNSAFSVNGFINVDGITGGYKIDSNKVGYASSTNFSTVWGIGAGTSLDATSTWTADTAFGYQALGATPTNNATVGQNTAVGYQALKLRTSGAQNTAVGYQAGANILNGATNVLVGQGAGQALTSGSSNACVGSFACATISTGSNNVALGRLALRFPNVASADNVAIGTNALQGTSGSAANQNIGIGRNAGNVISTGAANIFLGYNVGTTTTTGSNNIIIGSGNSTGIELPSPNGSNQLNIGNLIYGLGMTGTNTGTASTSAGIIGIATSTPFWALTVASSTGPQLALVDTTTTSNAWTFRNTGNTLYIATSTGSQTGTSSQPAITINPNGLVGIATTSPWRTFSLTGTFAAPNLTAEGATGNAVCLTTGGEVEVNAATTCLVSSKRYKHDIQPFSDGLREVMAMQAVSYKNNSDNQPNLGLIAEEVQKIDPRLVSLGKDGKPQSVKYENLTAVLLQAIQAQQGEIEILKARIGKLEGKK